jgi:three-Cys-motif partner protein
MPAEYDEIGQWSKVKLEIIKEYASAYSTVLRNQKSRFRYAYIEGFAGAGVHRSKTTGEFVPGSPTNALLLEAPFLEYHFIDLKSSRTKQLREIAGSRKDVFVYNGDCNTVLPGILDRFRWEDYRRALCILDPYDINLDWKVVVQAARLRTIEIFLNFMVMDINMNAALRNPDKVSPKSLERMDRFWGDRSWYDMIYEPQQTLFGEVDTKTKGNEALAEGYRQRLREVAGFRFVPRPIPMRTARGATIYYLFFASHNEKGYKIANDIFNKHRER